MSPFEGVRFCLTCRADIRIYVALALVARRSVIINKETGTGYATILL